MSGIHASLARANGRDQPAISAQASYLKTLAVRESGCRVAAVARGAVTPTAMTYLLDETAQPILVICDVMSARRANWTLIQLKAWPDAAAVARDLRDAAMRDARTHRTEFRQELLV